MRPRGQGNAGPSTCSDETWAAHLFLEDNVAGDVCEWWMHAPTSYWFIARRNTITEEIIKTYTVEEFFGAPEVPRPTRPAA